MYDIAIKYVLYDYVYLKTVIYRMADGLIVLVVLADMVRELWANAIYIIW